LLVSRFSFLFSVFSFVVFKIHRRGGRRRWGLKWLTKVAKGGEGNCPWRLAPQIIFQWPMHMRTSLPIEVQHVCACVKLRPGLDITPFGRYH
jgi:hypothetical protein